MAAQSPEEVHSLFFEALSDRDLNKLLAVFEEGAILIPRPGDKPVNAHGELELPVSAQSA